MANKRRPRKTIPPYKKYTGSGLPAPNAEEDKPDSDHHLNDETAEIAPSRIDILTLYNSQSQSQSVSLPAEILDLIFSHCPRHFSLLLTCRLWHVVALPHLYRCPELGPQNFATFVNAISKKDGPGSLVRDLDLVKIAQTGKNSMTARLLRRCSARLERFIAPQSHFGISPVMSLLNCRRLKILDLGLVTETVDLPQLLSAVKEFDQLEALYFPRSSIQCGDEKLKWPPNLRYLGLAGGVTASFLSNTLFPESLYDVTISNCPYVTGEAIIALLHNVGKTIKRLTIQYPMPLLQADTLDPVLFLCPHLRSLRVSIDYISSLALDTDNMPTNHPLQNLTLASSGMMGHADKIRPSDMLLATEKLTELRRVSTSVQLGWNPHSQTLAGLVEVLNERGGGVWLE